jgi:hypothetical protein
MLSLPNFVSTVPFFPGSLRWFIVHDRRGETVEVLAKVRRDLALNHPMLT